MTAKQTLVLIIVMVSLAAGGFQSALAMSEPDIKAHGGILLDAESKEIIFSKNADTIMYPASTTKIMTALLAVEHGNLDEIITIGGEVELIAWDSSRAYLQSGDRLSLRDAIYGMMLASGNDAAYAVAVHVARIESGDAAMSASEALKYFSGMMNSRAEEIGARTTNFVNPDGYPHKDHYTTAADLALIMAEAMKNPEFREFDSVSSHYPETWDGAARSWTNGNQLIHSNSAFFYEQALGGKTGFTHPAGFTMVATAALDENELVAVALKTDADGRWQDTINMLEYGFEILPQPEPAADTAEAQILSMEYGNDGEDQDDTVLPWPFRLLQWLNLI